MSPNNIHHTGDIQVPNRSITDQTDTALSYETNTTVENENECNYEDEVEVIQHTSSKGSDNVTYSEMFIKRKELESTVQNDKTMCKSIFTSLSHWISLLHHGEQLDIKFKSCVRNGCKVYININETVLAVKNGVLDPKHMNRKISNVEIRKHGNMSTTNTSVFNNEKK